jgi:glycine dehydrogenase subunit 1
LNRVDKTDVAAIIIQQPNFFGQIEDVDALTNWAHAQGFLVIAVVNPIAMALLKPPGQWGEKGADIVCGEGQPLGIPMASGGPYFGFFCTKQEFVRQMPGRIVGRTIDSDGKQGFVLTLQAREQHIRRSKATSNICTNQGLAVTAATIYLSLMGFEGLQKTALLSHQNLQCLAEELKHLPGAEIIFEGYRFHEIALRLPVPVKAFLTAMAKAGIEAGFDLSEDYPELGQAVLMCVTETKSSADLQTFLQTMKNCLQQLKQNNQCQVMGDVTC